MERVTVLEVLIVLVDLGSSRLYLHTNRERRIHGLNHMCG